VCERLSYNGKVYSSDITVRNYFPLYFIAYLSDTYTLSEKRELKGKSVPQHTYGGAVGEEV
jgi:hypothetical protein